MLGIRVLAIVVCLVAPAALAQEPSPRSLDDLLADLRASSWEDRENSTRILLERWATWTEADLERLDALSRSPDPESSSRAASLARGIRLRRALGEDLVKRGADRILLDGDPTARAGLVVDATTWYADGSTELDRLARSIVEFSIPIPLRAVLGLASRRTLRSYAPLILLGFRDPDASTRECAVEAAALAGGEEFAGAVIEALADEDGSVRWSAQMSIGRFRSPATIDGLLLLLARPEPCAREAGLDALGRLEAGDQDAISSCLGDPEATVRFAALWALGRVNATGRADQVAALIEDPDPGVRSLAIGLLVSWRCLEYVPAMCSRLDDPAPEVRERAIQGLGSLRATAHATAVAERLDDPSPEVRKAAVKALGDLGAIAHAARIAALVQDPAWAIRCEVAKTLGRLGCVERSGEVAGLLADPESLVRERAVEALADLGASEHVPAILGLLADDEGTVRTAALEALAVLGTGDQSPAIANLLSDREDRVRLAALEALARIGTPAEANRVIPLLVDPSPKIRAEVIDVLGEIGAPECGEAIASLLGHPRPEVRHSALRALARVRATDRVDQIVRALHDPDARARSEAVSALWELRAFDRLPEIAARLEDPESLVRGQALRVLERFEELERARFRAALFSDPAAVAGTETRKALEAQEEALVRRLEDPDPDMRIEVLEFLAWRGSKERVESVSALLDDPDARVRRRAVRTLEELRPEGLSAILFPHRLDPDPEFRVAVASVLQRLGDPDRRPDIEALLGDAHPSVRKAAVSMLGKGDVERIRRVAIRSDEDVEVRCEAIRRLRHRGDLETLLALASDSGPRIAVAALEAYVVLQGPEAAPRIAPLALTGSVEVRTRVLGHLGRWRHRGCVEALPQLLSDDAREVRESAARYAGRIGARDRIEDLFRMVEELDGSPGAGQALEELGCAGRLLSASMDRRSWLGSTRDWAWELPRRDAAVALRALESPQDSYRSCAVRTLAESGAWEARDRVVGLLEDPDSTVRGAAADAAGDMGIREGIPEIVKLLAVGDGSVRKNAVSALASLEAAEAAPAIAPLLEDEYLCSVAAYALVRLDAVEYAGDVARAAIRWSRNRPYRWSCFDALGAPEAIRAATGESLDLDVLVGMTPEILREVVSEGQVQGLIRLLEVDDTRKRARYCLENLLEADAERALELLSHPSPAMRRVALASLSPRRIRAAEARVRRMIEEDSDAEVRAAAAEALRPPDLPRLLRDFDPRKPEKPLRKIEAFASPEMESRLAAHLADPSSTVRVAAARSLARLGARSRAGGLADRLRAPAEEPDVRESVARALGELGVVEESETVAALAGDPEAGLRRAAVESLGWMAARDRHSELAAALEDPDPGVRVAAVGALARLGGTFDLAGLLSDPDGRMRRAAVEGLVGWGDLTAIEPALGDRFAPVRAAAARAYGRLGGAEDLARLAPLIEDPVASVRIEAVLALGRVGEADVAVQRLEALEKDPDRRVARAASVALVRRGEKDPEAIRELAGRVVAFGWASDRRRWSVELVEAIDRMELDRPIEVEEAIESLGDLGRQFESIGLELDASPDLRWRGRIAPGTRTTLRGLIGHCALGGVETLAPIGIDARIRLVSPATALELRSHR